MALSAGPTRPYPPSSVLSQVISHRPSRKTAASGTSLGAEHLPSALAGVLLARLSCRFVQGRPGASASNASRSKMCRLAAGSTDWQHVREDFPALQQEVKPGIPLVYLDNAATSQKPRAVLEELSRFYGQDNSNVHRGMHTLSMRSTEAFENARKTVAHFVNAPDEHEIIFTRNATEAINLVAKTWAEANIGSGDEIVLTVMEHHSNLVPWQLLAEKTGAKLKFGRLRSNGTLDVEHFESLITEKTKLVSLCHVSNVLGCVNPIKRVAEKCHEHQAKLLVDACQSVPHMPVDVQTLGADWLVASSHKMCGPTGIGFLWGRAELLRASPPFLGGGEMIDQVKLEGSTFSDIPHRFEAGTPAFAEAVALGRACEYLEKLTMTAITEREHRLSKKLWDRVAALPGVTIYGPSPEEDPERASLVCFNVEGCHANDLATIVDQDRGIAMRSGHHCTQPLHTELGIVASARLSAYFYNTEEEIDLAVDAVEAAIELIRSGEGEGEVLDPAMAALLDV
ncbi:unnamed protein product [Durusdinium trenchii]|uniref:cysteine desulfurase n=1 Tax=Durusdinium trenchii TaxID=1381693 RepID=A0ABP0KKF9_9DINO